MIDTSPYRKEKESPSWGWGGGGGGPSLIMPFIGSCQTGRQDNILERGEMRKVYFRIFDICDSWRNLFYSQQWEEREPGKWNMLVFLFQNNTSWWQLRIRYKKRKNKKKCWFNQKLLRFLAILSFSPVRMPRKIKSTLVRTIATCFLFV
jgi:hypothetical protein